MKSLEAPFLSFLLYIIIVREARTARETVNVAPNIRRFFSVKNPPVSSLAESLSWKRLSWSRLNFLPLLSLQMLLDSSSPPSQSATPSHTWSLKWDKQTGPNNYCFKDRVCSHFTAPALGINIKASLLIDLVRLHRHSEQGKILRPKLVRSKQPVKVDPSQKASSDPSAQSSLLSSPKVACLCIAIFNQTSCSLAFYLKQFSDPIWSDLCTAACEESGDTGETGDI